MSAIELVLLRNGAPVRTVPVSSRLVLGRSPSSDLVLADDDVSKHHAVLALEGAQLRISDLRSTNGTFVNDERVEDSILRDGDRLRLGPNVELLVRIGDTEPRGAPLVHDLGAGIRFTFDTDRLHIGSGADCTIRVPGPPRVATLLLDPDGVVWLGAQGAERPLELGEPFEIAGCRLVLESTDELRAPTVKQAATTRYPYRLRVTLNGPGGAVATFTHLDGTGAHQLASENRAVLLYVLARQLVSDRDAGVEPIAAGWCDDGDVVVGVWGRAATEQAPSALNVLVHRIRKELETSGFDPWCLEKRRGATRLRVEGVEIE